MGDHKDRNDRNRLTGGVRHVLQGISLHSMLVGAALLAAVVVILVALWAGSENEPPFDASSADGGPIPS